MEAFVDQARYWTCGASLSARRDAAQTTRRPSPRPAESRRGEHPDRGHPTPRPQVCRGAQHTVDHDAEVCSGVHTGRVPLGGDHLRTQRLDQTGVGRPEGPDCGSIVVDQRGAIHVAVPSRTEHLHDTIAQALQHVAEGPARRSRQAHPAIVQVRGRARLRPARSRSRLRTRPSRSPRPAGVQPSHRGAQPAGPPLVHRTDVHRTDVHRPHRSRGLSQTRSRQDATAARRCRHESARSLSGQRSATASISAQRSSMAC